MLFPAITIMPKTFLSSALKRIIYIVVFLFAPVILAQDSFNSEVLREFSIKVFKIEKNIKTHRYGEKNIPEAITQITLIKSSVTQCISEKELLQEKLKTDLASLGESTKMEPIAVRQKKFEIKSEIVKAEKSLANCRVLLLRSDESLKKLTASQQGLLAARLLANGPDIKHLIQVNWNKPSLWLKSSGLFLANNTGLELLSVIDITLLIVVITFVLFISLMVRKHFFESIGKKMMEDTFSNHFLRSVMSVSCFYLPHFFISLSFAIYVYSLTYNILPVPFLGVVAYGLPIYFLLVASVEVFLNPRPPAVSFHDLPVKVARALSRRLKLFILLLFIGYLLFTTLLTQSLPEETLLLSRGIFVLVFVLNLIWAVQLLGKITRFKDTLIIRFGMNLVLLAVLIAEFLGYRNLSGYVVLAVFGSLLAFGLFNIVSRLISELFDGLENGKRRWQRYIRQSLGVKSRKKLPELIWIRFIVKVTLWLTLAFIILKIWGLSEAGIQQINIILIEGFTVGTLKIIPARIVFAVITLTFLLALSRWFRAQLERSWLLRTNMERGAREAVATISGYIGVAISLIVSLSITGVEFGNVAIIAGALSVGIGFGLQNIVNNFVSGLILLFERPIKTGDWIVVGSTEGFVKRISIRSTQIQTFDQADVIVPNSDLISGQVTNWMLRDVKGRINVPVGVAYGSDTLLVQRLLMDVAKNNSMVVFDGSVPGPKVLFMAFGDSALMFELRAFIKNIDQKFQVTSDINFAIDAIFREHNIQIPFPQRDIHIKTDSGNDNGNGNDNRNGTAGEKDNPE